MEVRAAVVSNDKTANKENVKMASSEEDEGLLHTQELIWQTTIALQSQYTLYCVHIETSSMLR